MDFSLRRVEKENLHYYESDQDSSIQLVFVPGGFNPELWKHQIKYFSRKYKTICFQPTQSFRDLEGEKNALANVLEQEQVTNAVLISNVTGNSLIQEFEDHENVTATVFTGAVKSLPERSRTIYNFFWRFGKKNPKILKRRLFSKDVEYRVVKEFAADLEIPDFQDLQSFKQNYSIRRPSKPSLVIHAEDDHYSSISFARELRGSAAVSIIQRGGTLSYYEKPQEYNKALNDFLSQLEKSIQEKKIIETKSKNRSLFEFEQKQPKKKKKQAVMTK